MIYLLRWWWLPPEKENTMLNEIINWLLYHSGEIMSTLILYLFWRIWWENSWWIVMLGGNCVTGLTLFLISVVKNNLPQVIPLVSQTNHFNSLYHTEHILYMVYQPFLPTTTHFTISNIPPFFYYTVRLSLCQIFGLGLVSQLCYVILS